MRISVGLWILTIISTAAAVFAIWNKWQDWEESVQKIQLDVKSWLFCLRRAVGSLGQGLICTIAPARAASSDYSQSSARLRQWCHDEDDFSSASLLPSPRWVRFRWEADSSDLLSIPASLLLIIAFLILKPVKIIDVHELKLSGDHFMLRMHHFWMSDPSDDTRSKVSDNRCLFSVVIAFCQ